VFSGPAHDGDVRVLVIEDDERLAASLTRALEADGFAVDLVPDGPTGLRRAKDGDHDVIVCDTRPPGMSGYRVCNELREAGVWTPVLMLAATHDKRGEAEALHAGADDFLCQPFSYVVLLTRLSALLRGPTQRRPTVLVAGDLHLDTAGRQVSRAGTAIALSPREFSLLEFLMRRVGDVVSKATILDHVWEFAFEGDANIVEVYIRQLRLKIDRPFGRRAIETIRLVGYRLDPAGG
jgi:DNA-binding response OmpR family regulator